MGAPREALAERFAGVVSGAPTRPTPQKLDECESGLLRAFDRAGHTAEQVFEVAKSDTLVAAFSVWWTVKTRHRFRHLIGAELVERHGGHRQLEEAIRSLDGGELLTRSVALDAEWRSHGLQLGDVLRAWKRGSYLVADNVLAIGFQKTAHLARLPDAPALADAAFEALMEWRHREPLLRRLKHWGLADDAAHEVYQQLSLEFLRNGLAGFDPDRQKFGVYLHGAGWKKREDLRRRAARRGPTPPLEGVPDPPARPEGDIDRLEAKDLLAAALPRLAADNREQHDAVMMQHHGLSIQQIAEAQDSPTGTAGVRVKRGREKLRKIVEDMLDGPRGG